MKRRSWLLAAAVALVLGLAGCTQIRGTIDTGRAVRDAGFTDVSVRTAADNTSDTLIVEARTIGTDNADDAHFQAAAKAAYLTFPLKFDDLELTLRGFDQTKTETFGFDDLAASFPGRNPRFNRRTISQDFEHLGVGLLIGVGVAAVIGLGVIILIVVLLVRSSRRKRATAQAYNPWGGPGWGQPPPPGPAWGPPPPGAPPPPDGGLPPPPPPPGSGPPPWGQ